MEIYRLIKQDHQKLKDLLDSIILHVSPLQRRKIFTELQAVWRLHSEAEIHTFYHALKPYDQVEKEIQHAEEAHKKVNHLCKDLSAIPTEEEDWIRVLLELKRTLLTHIKDEENCIFSKARKLLSIHLSQELYYEARQIKKDLKGGTFH